jgi:hypothetical protein
MTDTSISTATIAQMLAQRQAALGASDQAIAEAMGYPNGAVTALLKDGRMKLPINKAHAFAHALDIEPGLVMRAALREMDPSALAAIERCLGPLHLSPGEARLITRLRQSSQGRDIAPVMFEKDSIVALVLAA